MKISNTVGNTSETKLSKYFKSKGYWCHKFLTGTCGTPGDFVVYAHGKMFLVDIKHCARHLFPTSRIEPNQHTSFRYAQSKGIECGFIIDYQEKLYYLKYENTLETKKNIIVETLPPLEDML